MRLLEINEVEIVYICKTDNYEKTMVKPEEIEEPWEKQLWKAACQCALVVFS